MSRALGPRPPFAAGNAALAWVLILAAWGLIALAWLAWAAARLAALAAGHGHVPPFGTRWVSALLHGHTAQAWPGVPTLLVARGRRRPGRRAGRGDGHRVAGHRPARHPARRSGRRAQPGPVRPPARAVPVRRAGHPAAALAGRQPAPAAWPRPTSGCCSAGSSSPAGDGPELFASWEDTLVAFFGPAVRQDHLARHPVRAVSARPGRGHQRQGRPVGRHRRAARRVRLTDLGVRPAGDHRRRAAVLGRTCSPG